MEKHNIIQVRASIVQASRSDVFDGEGIPLENKLLVLKNPFTKVIEGMYRIGGTDRYDIIELIHGLAKNQFFKLSEIQNETDFQFKLFLRPADEFDLFYTPSFQKNNVLHYVKPSVNSIVGPLYTGEFSDKNALRNHIENQTIYVPFKKQLFEPISKQKTA